jgi:two-component system sensor histidine kinase ArlS
MTLKNKISFIVSLLFMAIYFISATVIYFLFADFRKEEFESLLKEKALSSIRLLVEVEQVDKQLLKILDQNSINKLYNEKTLIFNADYYLIYSSLDDVKIKWTIEDLKYLKKNKTLFRKDKEQEVYGIFYDTDNQDYYALISATDNFGKRKLEYLLYILIGTYFLFSAITWFNSYYIVKKLLSPLYVFHSKLKGINESNLDTRVAVKEKKDEIDLLAHEFNQMLERIDTSYRRQKEFTANASHELRTPLSRITSKLENQIIAEKDNLVFINFIKGILKDINQLSELTNSLLLLSKLDSEINEFDEVCRIDDLIFEASEKLIKISPDFKLDLEFLEVESLEIIGNKSLLTISFANLLKNAYHYSDNKQAKVRIQSSENELLVSISNDGTSISAEEQNKLFQPFMRGRNSKGKMGLGLGLRIVQRILIQQKASIWYSISPEKENTFTIRWKFGV